MQPVCCDAQFDLLYTPATIPSNRADITLFLGAVAGQDDAKAILEDAAQLLHSGDVVPIWCEHFLVIFPRIGLLALKDADLRRVPRYVNAPAVQRCLLADQENIGTGHKSTSKQLDFSECPGHRAFLSADQPRSGEILFTPCHCMHANMTRYETGRSLVISNGHQICRGICILLCTFHASTSLSCRESAHQLLLLAHQLLMHPYHLQCCLQEGDVDALPEKLTCYV